MRIDPTAMEYVFVSSKVESRIEALEKAGKSGKTLARKASGIIDSLASGDVRAHMDTVGSYTKYGEKRIANCRKYDLGCGYRLITLQRGETVFIPFLGTHDACQRWLENNSRLKAFHSGKGNTIPVNDKKLSHRTLISVEQMDAAEEVNDSLPDLTEKELRAVFRGLVEGARKKL